MRRRVAVARNLAKAWLILLVPAGLMAFAGWKLGGYRLALLFGGSVVLLGAALYWYADRIVMGMVGARELLAGEAPALHSAVESLAARAGVDPAAARTCSPTATRARSRPGAARRAARRSRSRRGCSASRRRRSSRASSRTSSHISARRDVLVQTVAVIIASAVVEASRLGGWLAAVAPRRARPAGGLVRPPAPLAEARVRGRPVRRRALRRRRTGSPTRCSGSRARWSSSPSRPARRRSRSTSTNPFAEEGLAALFATHPPRRRARPPAARARPRVARQAARGVGRHERQQAPSPGPCEKKWAASYSPGRLLSEYHRR